MPYVGNIPAEKYAAFDVQHFTTSATTGYTLSHAVANENDIRLVINNVVQQPGSSYAYTASGTTLTLSSATSGTDTMYCVFLGKAVQTVVPPAGSVGINQLSATGTKDATTFLRGDNSFAVVSGTTINNNADNRVITGSGTANTLNGEANLRFDGSTVRVGSGTTSPDADGSDVVVEGSGNTGISILSGGTNSANLYLGTNGANNDGLIRYDNDGNHLKFYASATEIARMNHAGGDDQFFVHCTANPSGGTKGFAVLGQIIVSGSSSTSEQDVMRIEKPSGRVGSIVANNSSTSYNTSSDYRLKENQVAISDGITRLKTLKPYKFNFIVDKDEDDNVTKIVDGFFAHEVSSAVPEAVTGEKDAVDENGEIKPQAIDQSKLVPLLTSALQEAITKIETLEARVQALENA